MRTLGTIWIVIGVLACLTIIGAPMGLLFITIGCVLRWLAKPKPAPGEL